MSLPTYGMSAGEREMYSSIASTQLLQSAVSKIVGLNFVMAEHDEQGLTTLVYACETPDDSFIVRRGKNENAFRKDEYVGNLLAETGLFAPTVLGIKALEDNSFVCVTTRAAGETAQDEELLNPANPLNASLMQAMQHMHSITPSRSNETADLFAPIKRHPATVAYDKAGDRWHSNIDSVTLAELANVQQRLKGFTAPHLQSLTHGDIKGPNVLVRAGKITGIIDWAMAEFGDPASDLGRLYAPYPHAINYENYQLQGIAAEHLRERVLYYAMTTCVGSIRFFSGLRNEARVVESESRLIELAHEAESAY